MDRFPKSESGNETEIRNESQKRKYRFCHGTLVTSRPSRRHLAFRPRRAREREACLGVRGLASKRPKNVRCRLALARATASFFGGALFGFEKREYTLALVQSHRGGGGGLSKRRARASRETTRRESLQDTYPPGLHHRAESGDGVGRAAVRELSRQGLLQVLQTRADDGLLAAADGRWRRRPSTNETRLEKETVSNTHRTTNSRTIFFLFKTGKKRTQARSTGWWSTSRRC